MPQSTASLCCTYHCFKSLASVWYAGKKHAPLGMAAVVISSTGLYRWPRKKGNGSKLLFGGAVEDDADFFEGDEAAIDHFVEAGKNFFDALSGFDDFEDDGKILGEAEELVGVIDAGAAVAGDATNDRGTGEAFFTEHLDDGVMERFAVPFVGFADVDAHQGAFALEFLVGHGFSSLSSKRDSSRQNRATPKSSSLRQEWRRGEEINIQIRLARRMPATERSRPANTLAPT